MAKVQHYRNLDTNLDNLYSSIKGLLEAQKELRIISEYKGFFNTLPLKEHRSSQHVPQGVGGVVT
jgi:hypothetical protein